PAARTPLTAIRIAELAREAGLPDGVFQVVPGKGSVVGQRLVGHEHVRKIVFTGSTEVGQQIMAGCARQVKRLTLELGGKSANIVFADADLERAAAAAPQAVFDNAGQDSCARARIPGQRSGFHPFTHTPRPPPHPGAARPAGPPGWPGAPGRSLWPASPPACRRAGRSRPGAGRPGAPAPGSRPRCWRGCAGTPPPTPRRFSGRWLR